MPTQRPESIPVWEYVFLLYAIAKTLSTGLITLLLGPFRGSTGSQRLKNHVILAMLRTGVSTIKNSTLQYLLGSTEDTYLKYAKEKGFEPKWETLPSGLRAYWIGEREAEKVMIFFPGGGYALPPQDGHLPLCTSITAQVPNLAILIPAYTLTPYGTYPTQLRQAAETLHHVLHTLSRPPSSIILAGDSAGGNLVLGLISHLLHPHPELPKLTLPNASPLKAAICISPWATFDFDSESVRRNERKDHVGKFNGDTWSKAFLAGREKDEWNEPGRAGEAWWQGVGGVVEECLVTAGGDEVLLDGIGALRGRLEPHHKKLVYVEAEGEWHEPTCHLMPPDDIGISRKAILGFCGSRL